MSFLCIARNKITFLRNFENKFESFHFFIFETSTLYLNREEAVVHNDDKNGLYFM